MATIPTKEALRDPKISVGGAVPGFGGQEMAAITAPGRALDRMGDAIAGIGVNFQNEADKSEDFEVQRALIQHTEQQERNLEDAIRSMPEDGAGFADGWRGSTYDPASRSLFKDFKDKGFSERALHKLDQGMHRFGEDRQTRAYREQLKQEDRFHTQIVTDDLGRLTTRAIEDPDPARINERLSEGAELLRTSRLPPAIKNKAFQDFKTRTIEGAVLEMQRRDRFDEAYDAITQLPRTYQQRYEQRQLLREPDAALEQPSDITTGERSKPVGQIEAGTMETGGKGKRMTIVDDDGSATVIPMLDKDGKELDGDRAVEEFRATGRHLGKFDNADNANAYMGWLDRAPKFGQGAGGAGPQQQGAPGTRADMGDPGPDYRDQKNAAAAIRYNNPGAMYPGPSAARFGSTRTEIIGGGHKIAVFPDAVSGAAAQFDLLNRSYAGLTLGAAITKWSGGNSSAEYAASVSKAIGIGVDQKLTKELLADPKVAIPLAKAAAKIEAGGEYPLSDAQWQAAFNRAQQGGASAAKVMAGGGEQKGSETAQEKGDFSALAKRQSQVISRTPGVIAAITDQTERQFNDAGYGDRITGKITVNGNTYTFVNGGSKRGSIPFGEYEIGKFWTGQERAKAGFQFTRDSFDLSSPGKDAGVVDDDSPGTAGDKRRGILVHSAKRGVTEGCVGIEGDFKQFVRDVNAEMAANGGQPLRLQLGPVQPDRGGAGGAKVDASGLSMTDAGSAAGQDTPTGGGGIDDDMPPDEGPTPSGTNLRWKFVDNPAFPDLPMKDRLRIIEKLARSQRIADTDAVRDGIAAIQNGQEPGKDKNGLTAIDRARRSMTDMQYARWARTWNMELQKRQVVAPLARMRPETTTGPDGRTVQGAYDYMESLPPQLRQYASKVWSRMSEIKESDPARFYSGGTLDKVDRAPRLVTGADGMPVAVGDVETSVLLPPAPEVAQAMAALREARRSGQPMTPAQHQSMWARIFDARLAAQARDGVPAASRYFLTRAEGRELLKLPLGKQPTDLGQWEEMVRGALKRAEASYGPVYAREAVRQALDFQGYGQGSSKTDIADDVLGPRKPVAVLPGTRRAAGGAPEDKFLNPRPSQDGERAGWFDWLGRKAPDAGKQPGGDKVYPIPGRGALTALGQNRDNPAAVRLFEQTYGPGSAAQALGVLDKDEAQRIWGMRN